MATREKMKAFRDKSRAEIEEILTPEQFAQYKKILSKDRMKSRRGQ
jgi:Spy/CpxP family protein refolding chaperone